MSIQSFTLRNYRSFVDRTTIELRPLMLLFGYNNTGKSVLLHTLPLIADSLTGQSTTPLALPRVFWGTPQRCGWRNRYSCCQWYYKV